MIAFAYIIPLIACILLHFEFGYDGKWSAYLWIILLGEGTVGLGHWLFLRINTSRIEYLGSMVSDINHEESWTELVKVSETKKDNQGNSYTVTRIKERFHKEQYYFHTTIGTRFSTDYGFYAYVRDIWNLPRTPLSWSGNNIKGGIRYGSRYELSDFEFNKQENPENWIPITESHNYINKIQASNSIFKFEEINKREAHETGLIDYPAICSYDAPCVLSNDIVIPDDVDELFRKFNARYAPEFQMRLYVLLFDANKGIGISELQRAYWQGGNKNEFVICVGMRSGGVVEWARAFSWADEQSKEVEVAQWLMHHPDMNWTELYDWLRLNLIGWKRKEFKDFNYINVSLPLWQILVIYVLSIAENILAIHITLD